MPSQMGKFSHSIDEFLWELTMDGVEDEIGGVTETGTWYGLIHLTRADKVAYRRLMAEDHPDERNDLFGVVGAIIWEDGLGFVDSSLYRSEAELRLAWDEVLTEQSALMDENDEEQETYDG